MSSAPAQDGTRERSAKALEGIEHDTSEAGDGMVCIDVEREALRETLRRLRDRAGFAQVTFITAIDHHPAAPRFEISHQLWAYAHSDRVRVRTRLAEDDATLPSCVDLWPGAAFMERECFDMFGVVFDGHDGLKRLLMPEEYEHHPLRKEFPHQGIEPDKLYREWDAERRRVWEASS